MERGAGRPASKSVRRASPVVVRSARQQVGGQKRTRVGGGGGWGVVGRRRGSWGAAVWRGSHHSQNLLLEDLVDTRVQLSQIQHEWGALDLLIWCRLVLRNHLEVEQVAFAELVIARAVLVHSCTSMCNHAGVGETMTRLSRHVEDSPARTSANATSKCDCLKAISAS